MFAVIIPYSIEFIHIPVFTKRYEFLMIFYNILMTIALPIDSDVKFKVQFIGKISDHPYIRYKIWLLYMSIEFSEQWLARS